MILYTVPILVWVLLVSLVGILGYLFINRLFPRPVEKQTPDRKHEKNNFFIELRMLEEYMKEGKVNEELLTLINQAKQDGQHYIHLSKEQFYSLFNGKDE